MGTRRGTESRVAAMSTVAPGLASSPFGMSAHVRRPVLLILVYGIFLMIVGVTATAQAVMVSAHFSTNTLNSIVSTDTTLVRAFVRSFVSPDDFAAGALPGERQAIIERQLRTLVAPGNDPARRGPATRRDASSSPTTRPSAARSHAAVGRVRPGDHRRFGRRRHRRRRRERRRRSRARDLDRRARVLPAQPRRARSSASSGSGATRCRSSPSSTRCAATSSS